MRLVYPVIQARQGCQAQVVRERADIVACQVIRVKMEPVVGAEYQDTAEHPV